MYKKNIQQHDIVEGEKIWKYGNGSYHRDIFVMDINGHLVKQEAFVQTWDDDEKINLIYSILQLFRSQNFNIVSSILLAMISLWWDIYSTTLPQFIWMDNDFKLNDSRWKYEKIKFSSNLKMRIFVI